MFQRRNRISFILHLTADLLLTGLAFVGSYKAIELCYQELNPLTHYSALLVILPVWAIILSRTPLYQPLRFVSLLDILLELGRSVLIGTLAIFAYLYLFKKIEISRLLVLLFSLGDFLVLLGWKALLKYGLLRRWNRLFTPVNVLVVGMGSEAHDLLSILRQYHGEEIQVLGLLAVKREEYAEGSSLMDFPVIGHLEQIEEILRHRVVDEVVFAVSAQEIFSVRGFWVVCQEFGVNIRIKSDFFSGMIAKTKIEEVRGLPLLSFSTTPQQFWQLLAKRGLDRILALFLLVFISPLLGLIALLIKATSSGPAIYSQVRVGWNGRRFIFYKFRTMKVDADALKSSLLSSNEMNGPVFKIRNDPRITPVGKWLRRYSLDELPQLYNILRGEMSFVGPRPPLPEEIERYQRWQRRRLSMRPGLTGLWQISGRNLVDFEEWMKLDLYYIDHWSLKMDLLIVFRTIPVVLAGKGAM